MNLEARISSIKDSLQSNYNKPNPELVLGYIKNLSENSVALDYLHIARGFSNETIENFKLGYDTVRNAISIPVYKRGELINIRYRHLDPNATNKYTQEKGCEVWLYNEDGIEKGKQKGGVLIVEGEFDCMSCWQAGFKNTISPASGKDSYGIWLELIDVIPKVFIAYDNDKPGKTASLNLSERIGTDKSFEVLYPDGIKDANDYFKLHTTEEYRELIRNAKPYYKYTYQGLDSVIDAIKRKGETRLRLNCLPHVKIDTDWMVVVSGVSGVGKTSYVMNIANELLDRDIPTLVLPFERGIKTIGGRFIQVRCNKTEDELIAFDDSDWSKYIPDLISLPLYMSMPTKEQLKGVVEKAKRLFGIKVVIIDHLDYSIGGSDNKVEEMQRVLQEWKSICIDSDIIFIVVHHIKKQQGMGAVPKKPVMEDLKGGSSVYQVPEAVVMLSQPERGKIEVDIIKNKGEMGSKIYEFNDGVGKIGNEIFIHDKKKLKPTNDEEPTEFINPLY